MGVIRQRVLFLAFTTRTVEFTAEYINKKGDVYVGHCPKCMHKVRVKIGPTGTGNRFFKCFCP